MKTMIKYVGILLVTMCLVNCTGKNGETKVLKTVEDAQEYIDESFQDIEGTIAISDELMDPVGINMAIIMDGVIGKGYMPDGFEQKNGYRIYKFRKD